MLLWLFFIPACAPRPYYADYLFEPPQLVETDRSQMVIHLDWMSRSNRIKRIEVQTPESGLKVIHPRESDSPDIDWLPLPVLYAAWFILDTKLKGLEVDLIARTEADGFVPVSARYDIDDTVHLTMGKPMASLLPSTGQLLTPAQLQQLYGVGPIREDGRAWRPFELYSLEQALALLSVDERMVTAELPFVRKVRAETATRGLKLNEIWGQYHSGGRPNDSREIRLFDTIEGHDQALFIGEPEHPHPLPTMCLLHEIAHAIADYPRILIERECEQQAAEDEKLVALWNQQTASSTPDAPRLAALTQKLAALKTARQEHLLRHQQLSQQYRRFDGPVLAAYLAVRGPDRGPTKYGRTADAESFAESFALFRADPPALQRIYPNVYEWFASGGHMKAMHEAIRENSGPPNIAATDTHSSL